MHILYIVLCILVPVMVFLVLWKYIAKDEHRALLLSDIAFLVAYVPVVVQLYDDVFPARVTILALHPVCVVRERQYRRPSDDWPEMTWPELTMYLVADLQNGPKAVDLTSLHISGNLPVPRSMYLSLHTNANVGKTLPELAQEHEQRKPYYKISWIASPEGGESFVHLEPNESRFLTFRLWEPILGGQRASGYYVPLKDYIGFADGSQEPKRTNGIPSVVDLCDLIPVSGGLPERIRAEFRTQDISMQLISGKRTFPIDMNLLKPLRRVSHERWQSEHISRILHGGDSMIKE